MREILGQLEEYFNKTEPNNEDSYAKCTYKNDTYEVWKVSEDVYEDLGCISEEKWEEKYPNSWWRYCDGCNLGYPDTKIIINGVKLVGWNRLGDEDFLRLESLTSYLHYCIGASQPKNVCAVTKDLAKYNNMTMGELWVKCEPK